MKIKCEACSTVYSIPLDEVGKHGRVVKCVRCGRAWKQDRYPTISIRVLDGNSKEILEWCEENDIICTEDYAIASREKDKDVPEAEPAMEDILASIRRILSEDDSKDYWLYYQKDAMLFKLRWC